MLHWFAGTKAQEAEDADTTGYIEPPETPAPVFAVRAFKQAIFGTPGTVPPKALRRHSNTEDGKPRPNARPAMTRPKSTGNTYTLGSQEDAVVVDQMPLPSPTKGILMTPGTAAARRKTVSFGAQVQDNEGKRQGKSGLPDSCPGKFPSPFVKSTEAEDGKIEATDKARGRNKLTEKLEQVREESAKRKPVPSRQSKEPPKESDTPVDSDEPSPEHWKIVYEQYRERSERECRKLVSKQRAAKSYAREKDEQLMQTADNLRQEKKKVDRLEKQLMELMARLDECQEKLDISEAEVLKVKDENTRLKGVSGLSGYRRHGDAATTATTATTARANDSEVPERETVLKTRTSRERISAREQKSSAVVTAEDTRTTTRPRARRRQQAKKEHDDVWAPSLAESSLIPPKSDGLPPPSSPKAGRASTVQAPLKSLNINTLPQESISVALSMGMQPPSPQRETRADSPMRSPTRFRSKPTESDSIAVPDSSTFLPDAENERPNILTGTPVPIRSSIRANASAAKENGTPTPKARRAPRENLENKSLPKLPVTDKVDSGAYTLDDALRDAQANLTRRGRNVS